MSTSLDGKTAIWVWRYASDAEILGYSNESNPFLECPSSPDQLARFELDCGRFGPLPIHLIVPDEKLRISRGAYEYKVLSKPLPEHAFRRIDDNVCIVSPEMCILEYATHAPRPKLIELCYEFCGLYALDQRSDTGFRNRGVQLCTVSSLKSFAEEASQIAGSKKVRAILKYLKDGSRSPMETRVHMLACLPRRFGGYGLPQAELNTRVELLAKDRTYANRQYFECDICWPTRKVVIEYDGHAYHETRENRARDATKRNTLLAMGYKVFTLTSQQVSNARLFDVIMHDVAGALAYKIRSTPYGWESRRDDLRRELWKSHSFATGHDERFSQHRN